MAAISKESLVRVLHILGTWYSVVQTDYYWKCKLNLLLWKLTGKVFQMVVDMLIIFLSHKTFDFTKKIGG